MSGYFVTAEHNKKATADLIQCYRALMMVYDSHSPLFVDEQSQKTEIMADVILVQWVLLDEGLMSTLLQTWFAFSGSCCST